MNLKFSELKNQQKKNVCLLSLLFETLDKTNKSVKTEGNSVASKPGMGGERREKL